MTRPISTLERYWPHADDLVIYPDLAPLTGELCKAKRGNHDVWEIVKGKAPPKSPRWAGAVVVDAGELKEPVRTFDELAEVLDSEEAETLRRAIERGRVRFVMVRYRRQEYEAALALIAKERKHRSPVRGRCRSRWRIDLPSAGGPGCRSPRRNIRRDRRGRSRRIPAC